MLRRLPPVIDAARRPRVRVSDATRLRHRVQTGPRRCEGAAWHANERAHWLAVYALGLTAAGNLKDAVTDPTAQADYDAEVLDVAHSVLEETYTGDCATREGATDLLSAGIARARRSKRRRCEGSPSRDRLHSAL